MLTDLTLSRHPRPSETASSRPRTNALCIALPVLSACLAGLLLKPQASAQAPEPISSWYLALSALGDYDQLGRKLFPSDLPAVGGLDSASSETVVGVGGGGIVALGDRFELDFGVTVGSGELIATYDDPELGDAVDAEARLDVDLVAARAMARYLVLGRSARAQPFVSAGVGGLLLRPHGGTLAIGGESIPLEEPENRGTIDFIGGVGVEIPVTSRSRVSVVGEHGFETGWRLGVDLRFAVGARDLAPEGVPVPDDAFKTESAPTCRILAIHPDPAPAGTPVGVETFAESLIPGCHLFYQSFSTAGSSATHGIFPSGSLTLSHPGQPEGTHTLCIEVSHATPRWSSTPQSRCVGLPCRDCRTLSVTCDRGVPPGTYCGRDHHWWNEQVCQARRRLRVAGASQTEITGTAGADLIIGNDLANQIDGDDGDDCIYGGGGNDEIDGGRGNDEIHGGLGDDTIRGHGGADILYGEDGDDSIHGDQTGLTPFISGDDTIYGGSGDDRIWGDAGDDQIFGGSGRDSLKGDAGSDTITGDEGDDFCKGDSGNDTLRCGAGDDRICGDSGRDSIDGGSGQDSCRPKGNCEDRARSSECTTSAWNDW